ncbi:MAG TPA: ATP-binding cassette domain-containing protein [Gemmatimonadaceae bacterium]|nr:ATP-binding cassette domain-containing protein [Gemmatimonadaceae bacterium]
MTGGGTSVVPVPVDTGRRTHAIAVDGLTGPVGTPVIHDVTLAVLAGRTHVVLGAMHSGKSLLLRLILGLQRSRHGTVTIDDAVFDMARPNESALAQARRRVGVVFDSSALVSRLTLLQNVELPLLEHTTMDADAARDVAERLLGDVGLRRDIERTPDQATRLDRRLVALARALALEPMLLLIDEPGHGLDADAAAELDDALFALRQRFACAALICSQEVRYAFRAPESVSILAAGAVVANGTLDALQASPVAIVRRLVDRRGAA